MVMSKYECSNLGPTLKVKFREKCFVSLQYKLIKNISDCLICYNEVVACGSIAHRIIIAAQRIPTEAENIIKGSDS